MKVVILAGGLGTRISEETENKPKPMVLIDDKPILWHLMNIFSVQGYNEFVLALGYRGDVIKRWLLDLNDLSGDIEISTVEKKVRHIGEIKKLSWKVSALETGLNTQTGGRIARCMKVFPKERVLVTYGDGLANVNINELLLFHESHGKKATVTAVRPPARFGHMEFDGNIVKHFGEKNQSDAGWINGGFFILEPEVAEYVLGDHEPFESGALPKLVDEGELMAYYHKDFWQPMDTLREKQDLAKLASLPIPPWLVGLDY
jgi:glucose-1-phosphate cytidylyltransferase